MDSLPYIFPRCNGATNYPDIAAAPDLLALAHEFRLVCQSISAPILAKKIDALLARIDGEPEGGGNP